MKTLYSAGMCQWDSKYTS